MSDGSWELQQAVYAALDAALSVPVYDFAPSNAAFPYVTIGEATIVDVGTKSHTGTEHTITVHAWSRYRGRKETKQILGQIYDALHEQTLNVSGFGFVMCRLDFSESFMDEDGLTFHGVARYRVVLNES